MPATGVWDTWAWTNLYALTQGPPGSFYGGSVEHGNGSTSSNGHGGDPRLADAHEQQGGDDTRPRSNNLNGIASTPPDAAGSRSPRTGSDIWNGNGTVQGPLRRCVAPFPWTGFPSPQTRAVRDHGGRLGMVRDRGGLVRIRNEKLRRSDGHRDHQREAPLAPESGLGARTRGKPLGRHARRHRPLEASSGVVESWSTSTGWSGRLSGPLRVGFRAASSGCGTDSRCLRISGRGREAGSATGRIFIRAPLGATATARPPGGSPTR